MGDISHVDVDEILIALGSTGRYQILKYFLSSICWFTEAFHGLGIVFIAIANQQTCFTPPSNFTNATEVIYEECSISYADNGTVYESSSCNYGYQYQQPKDRSLISDFDLVCEYASLSDLSQTLMYVGMGIGSSTLPMAADAFGRKPVCLFCNMCCLIIGIVTSFSQNYTMFAIMRVLVGICIQGVSLPALTIAIEIFPTDKRRIVGAVGMVLWAFLVSALALVAYLFRMFSWRILNLAIISVSAYSLIQYWVMDESLRWLIANNKKEETVRIIKKAARMNKVDPLKPLQILYQEELLPMKSPTSNDKLLPETKNKNPEKSEIKNSLTTTYTILDIFRSRRFAVTLLILWFTWFTNSLVYYGLFLTTSTLAGNIYLNFFLNCIVELPAAIIYWYCYDRIGRKKTSILLHLIAAFGLIVSTVFRLYDTEWAGTAATVFALIGKMGIAGSFTVIYCYTTEIFPTNIRTISFGSASTAARIGAMLAPFTSLLAANIAWAPGAIFGVCCLIVTILLVFLPETAGKELPQTMEDLNNLYKKR